LEPRAPQLDKPQLPQTQVSKLSNRKNDLMPEFLHNFIEEMRNPRTGIPIKDRQLIKMTTKESITHPKCFVGSEGVDWLVNHQRVSRRDARIILQNLLQVNIFYDIANENGENFVDGNFFLSICGR